MSSLGLNISVLSIPAYYVLAFLPHLYANWLGTNGNLGSVDYSNPRAASHINGLKANLNIEQQRRFERAKAASANAYENAALLVGAVLASHIAGVDKDRIDTYAVRFLIARAAHSFFYIITPGPKYYQLRSMSWMASMGLSFSILYEAAKKLS